MARYSKKPDARKPSEPMKGKKRLKRLARGEEGTRPIIRTFVNSSTTK